MRAEIEIARLVAKDNATRDLTLAWNTAALVRMAHDGKLPKLDQVLSHLTEKRQNVAEQRTALQMLSARYGIPLKERTH